MKTEDFERIENFCKQEGFEIESYCGGKTVIIGKKDPWEGVDFVKSSVTGVVYKKNSFTELFFNLSDFYPSFESEYVEQLKKEAFERFGEIKEGDFFQSVQDVQSKICSNPSWVYHKEFDLLCYGGTTIYQSGKWATRVPKKAKVKSINTTLYATQMDDKQEIEIRFESSKPINKSKQSIADFLSEQLEKFLNNEN